MNNVKKFKHINVILKMAILTKKIYKNKGIFKNLIGSEYAPVTIDFYATLIPAEEAKKPFEYVGHQHRS